MTIKRTLEILLASVVLLPVTLLSLILMIAIRIDTPGAPLLFQKRVGRYGRIFSCYKLRTFYIGSEVVASHEAAASTITPLGRRLRPLHLDELPQVFNVLLGTMSFVGPRPCLPFMADVIEARRHYGVDKLRPGITGLAQLEGIDMSKPAELARMDAIYAQNQSVLLNVRICLATIMPPLWAIWRHRYVFRQVAKPA